MCCHELNFCQRLLKHILDLQELFVERMLMFRKVDETSFETDEEKALWSAFLSIRSKIHPGIEVDDFVETSSQLIQPLEEFFTHVFVMVEDEKIRKTDLLCLEKFLNSQEE